MGSGTEHELAGFIVSDGRIFCAGTAGRNHHGEIRSAVAANALVGAKFMLAGERVDNHAVGPGRHAGIYLLRVLMEAIPYAIIKSTLPGN